MHHAHAPSVLPLPVGGIMEYILTVLYSGDSFQDCAG